MATSTWERQVRRNRRLVYNLVVFVTICLFVCCCDEGRGSEVARGVGEEGTESEETSGERDQKEKTPLAGEVEGGEDREEGVHRIPSPSDNVSPCKYSASPAPWLHPFHVCGWSLGSQAPPISCSWVESGLPGSTHVIFVG